MSTWFFHQIHLQRFNTEVNYCQSLTEFFRFKMVSQFVKLTIILLPLFLNLYYTYFVPVCYRYNFKQSIGTKLYLYSQKLSVFQNILQKFDKFNWPKTEKKIKCIHLPTQPERPSHNQYSPLLSKRFGVAYVAVSVMWIISIGIPSSLLAILIKVTPGTLANFRQNSKNNMAKIGTPFSYVGWGNLL